MTRTLSVLAAILCVALAASAQQKDDPNCKDHQLFTRMPGSWIHSCQQRTFDAFDFVTAKGKTTPVEGQYWRINYYPQANVNPKPSELQILRNFENAARKLGGSVLYAEKAKETMKLEQGGKEFWVQVTAEFTGKYSLIIVEKKGMSQDIEANADAFANDLKLMGHSAVYGILFDTGKSECKPESGNAIAEVAKLLKSDPALKLFVVGHTDNVGGVEANLRLSQERSDAVVKILTGIHGIAANRLKGFGAGPFAPVAANDAEQGRARNRRVELVRQ